MKRRVGRFLSHKMLIKMQMCGQKPRLENSQRAKFSTQASGCESFWSWAVLMWVRGWQGNSSRKGLQQFITVAQHPAQSSISPFAICLCLALVLPLHGWPWGADCLSADAAGSLQWCILFGAAVFFSGQWEPELGCWRAHWRRVEGGGGWVGRVGDKGCLKQLPQMPHWEHDLKLLCKTPAVFNTECDTVLKMDDTVLSNILTTTQSSNLIDSIWTYIYIYIHHAAKFCMNSFQEAARRRR